MARALRRSAFLAVLAAGFAAVGCAGGAGKRKELEDENKRLSAAVDDLQRRNQQLEQMIKRYEAEDPIRAAYIKKLEEEAALAKRLGEIGQGIPGTVVTEEGWDLEGDFFFRPGSDDVSKEGVESLKKVAAVLKSEDCFVRVVGHTDSDPIRISARENPTKMNLELGARRATSVASELKKAGVEEIRMHTVSMGQAVPVATGTARDDKKKNRRVQIMVSKSPPKGFAPSAAGGTEEKPAPKPEPSK